MIRALIFMFVGLSLSAGCARVADSQLNPMNWFSNGASAEIDPSDIEPLVPEHRIVRSVDNRAIVPQITALEVTPTSGGALVQASGIAAASGTYSSQLVLRSRSAGTLSYEIRTFQGSGGGGRTVSVAEFVSNGDLVGISRIEVVGTTNSIARRAR